MSLEKTGLKFVDLIESDDFEALTDAKKLLEDKLATLRDEHIARLRQQITKQASLLGVTPEQLFGTVSIETPTIAKGVPRYKDPNSAATWSGKGKPPAWIKAYLEAGGTKEDLQIRDEKEDLQIRDEKETQTTEEIS